MNENLFVNLLLSLGLIILGFVFLSGLSHAKKGSIWGGNIDILIFPIMKDRRVLTRADQLAFMICITMSVLTLLNGIITSVYPAIPNVSAIFIFIGLFLSWPIRIIFVIMNKGKKYNDVPIIWPFRK